MSILLSFLFWIAYIYLSFWAIYFMLFAIVGHLGGKKHTPRSHGISFLILIPAYKEDAVIIESAQKAAEHNYPCDYFNVLVIADSLTPDTVETLRQIPISVLEVEFEKSTKSKSLNAALNTLSKEYDAVAILDADNLMQDDFLAKMATRLKHQQVAVQGHRIAKNRNTHLAYLDAISEEINNHIFRQGHRIAGLSSALIGSAMVFEFRLFKSIMAEIDAIGGFDRELELRLIDRGIKIDYIPDAYVLDEKVQRQEVFQNQRRRWLSAQLHYFGRYYKSGFKALLEGRIDYADKVVQGIQVPRLLLPGLILILGLASAIANVTPSWIQWAASFTITIGALLISIPRKLYSKQMLKSMMAIPSTFINMLLLLFKLKGANKTFIHTAHGEQSTTKEATHSH